MTGNTPFYLINKSCLLFHLRTWENSCKVLLPVLKFMRLLNLNQSHGTLTAGLFLLQSGQLYLCTKLDQLLLSREHARYWWKICLQRVGPVHEECVCCSWNQTPLGFSSCGHQVLAHHLFIVNVCAIGCLHVEFITVDCTEWTSIIYPHVEISPSL